MSRPPSPATVRARELLRADPTLPVAVVLAQLQSEGLTCSAVWVGCIASGMRPHESGEARIAATRAALLRLAASVGYAELHGDQPAPGWRRAVAKKLGFKSPVFIGQAWRSGVAPATRAKWTEIISTDLLAHPQAPR